MATAKDIRRTRASIAGRACEVDAGDVGVTFLRAHERLADIRAASAAPLILGVDVLVSVLA